MKYIKLFDNHSQYESYAGGGGMLKPNVSHCVSENEVHYNPIPHDYKKDYFTIESLEDNNAFVWVSRDGSYSYTGNPISYSLDNGKTWNSLSEGVIATVNSGDKILLKAINSSYHYTGYSGLILTCGIYSRRSFNAYGNILSMIFGDDFTNTNNKLNGFIFTFKESEIISAENLIMPSEFGENGTIENMFAGCESLITAPQLPSTALTSSCYSNMFRGCTSLTTAPELPVTTLADSCYYGMFRDCTSLTVAPELPATELSNNCYYQMFQNCTGITSEAIVPDSLDKPISSSYCAYMYCNCQNITPNGNYHESAYQCGSPK